MTDAPPSQSHQPSDRTLPVQDPRLVPFLPLIYVAWSDGDLTPDEIREICRRIDQREDLDHDCRQALGRWLDPEKPPAAADLQRMLSVIRQYGDAPGSPSLADLGIELARLDQRVEGVERQALEEVEQALGLATREAARLLLADGRPKPEEAAERPAPAFDVEALAHLLDASHHQLRNEVRRLLGTEAFAYEPELDRRAYREKVLRLVKILADHGYGGLSFPTTTGGGGEMSAFIAVFETLAYGDLSVLVKFGVQFGLFGGSILQLGTEEHHRRYLADVASLELPGCFAMSETGHGSNVRDIETVARYDVASEAFIIHTPDPSARKDWIGNAALHGRLATVFAQLEIGAEEYGVHAFLVPIRDAQGQPLPGVEIKDCGHKLGLNGVDNGRLGFDQVSIPRANLLDRFASVAADGTYESPIPSAGKRFFTMLGTLVGGRVSVALAALSAAKSGLTIAVRYGDRRRQFGPAGEAEVRILDYLSHQRRLLPRLATTYALHFGLRHLARRYEESSDDDRREVETLAAGLKSYSSWHTIDTLQTCRECCGGKGYLTENRFATLKADTDVFATFEGDNTVLLQLVAKGLLSGYKRRFGEMNVFDMARYVAERAATGLAELNPVITRRSDEEHLRDRDFQLAALRWREEHLLGSVARRLKKRIDDGMDSFQAMIQVQDHLLKLALAHVERVLLEQFAAALEACEDEALREILTDVCDLFALARLEADRGWYLSQGYVEAGKSKAIRNLVNDLCRQLRPQAVPLVDAFAIPDEVLAAPIAT